MHWAPIPITEFELTSTTETELPDEDVFRLLSRGPRRGFWVTAIAFIVLLGLAFGEIAFGQNLAAVTTLVLTIATGTAHLLIRHKLNAALWIAREPAAVFWAETRPIAEPPQRPVFSLTLHTPAPVRLEALVSATELTAVLHWLRNRNPDALIGRFSPDDSDGRLSGTDPWSPQDATPVQKPK